MLNKFKKNNNKGFTLVELLVVIAIIGVLAVVAVPTLFGQIDKARVADVNSNVAAIKSAAMAYYADNGQGPTLSTTPADGTDLVAEGYLDSIPNKDKMTYTVTTSSDNVTTLTVDNIKGTATNKVGVSLKETYGASNVKTGTETGTLQVEVELIPSTVK